MIEVVVSRLGMDRRRRRTSSCSRRRAARVCCRSGSARPRPNRSSCTCTTSSGRDRSRTICARRIIIGDWARRFAAFRSRASRTARTIGELHIDRGGALDARRLASVRRHRHRAPSRGADLRGRSAARASRTKRTSRAASRSTTPASASRRPNVRAQRRTAEGVPRASASRGFRQVQSVSVVVAHRSPRRGRRPIRARRVDGRVVRGMRERQSPIANQWVVLHRVGRDRAGPLDSVRTTSTGAFKFRYRSSGDSDAVYFVSTSYGGVAYFTPPLPRPGGSRRRRDAHRLRYDFPAGRIARRRTTSHRRRGDIRGAASDRRSIRSRERHHRYRDRARQRDAGVEHDDSSGRHELSAQYQQ